MNFREDYKYNKYKHGEANMISGVPKSGIALHTYKKLI